MENSFRAFFAIDMSETANYKIVSLIKQLKASGKYPQIKWTKSENLHLTMRFLGNISFEQYTQLTSKVNDALKICAPFELHFTTMMLFPSKNRQIALALKPEPLAPLIQLNQILEQAAAACGLKPEPRPFVPHLTLGKIKGKPIYDFNPIKLSELTNMINNLKLYCSETSENGSIYTPLVCFLLG
jgi:2'-5' RNA ligase